MRLKFYPFYFFIFFSTLLFAFHFPKINFQISLASEPEWTNPINLRELNSSKDDFAPQWNRFERRLYFASNRIGNSKFFVSDLNFVSPKELTDPINKNTRNVSYISFFSETEAVLNAFRKGNVQAYLNVFYTQRLAGQWQRPTPLDSLQCDCFVLHPTISPSGTSIIFASDKESPGQLDLYVSYRSPNGIWGNVEKIEELCTDENEITPFLASDDTLYFASNGFGGPGGFDLFYSVRKENSWDKPIPLSQLNTRFDESDFVIINDTLAIFASNSIGGLGGLDLYLAKRIRKELATEYPPKLDLSLSVQIPIVRVIQECEYELVQFPQIVSYPFLLSSVNFQDLDENLIPSIDLFEKGYISILFKRIISSNSEVVLSYDTSNSDVHLLILQAIDFFTHKYSKLKELIKIEYSIQDYLFVQASNQNLFNPIKLGKLKQVYEPPVLEISINARPEKLLSNFEFKIRNTFVRRNGKKIPFYSSIELIQDSLVNISNSDTLIIDLVAEDTFGLRYTTSYPILLNRSSVLYRSTINFKGKKFEKIFLASTTQDLDIRKDFAKLFEELPQYSDNISEIILVGKFVTKPIGLISKIATTMNIPQNKIVLIENVGEFEKSYGKIPPNFFVLLVERR